jgi:hypothetical protein
MFMKIIAFWDIALHTLVKVERRFKGAYRPDDEGSTHLRNIGLIQRDYVALYPKRL